MNLGAFADGALKGYMGAEELKLKQQRQANDDARAKGEQEDRDVKAKSRERQAKAQADITALGRELLPEQYGTGDAQPAAAEQPAGQPAPQGQPAVAGAAPQVGAVGQAPAGNLSQAPAVAAPAKPQRDLLSRQMEFTTKAMRIALENSDNLDPTMLAKAHEYTSKMLATEEGQKIYKALGGDSEAINGLAQSLGLDVASAKVVQDPSKGVFQITDSKGKAVDLRQHALYKNAYDVVEALGKRRVEAQGDEKHASDIKSDAVKNDYYKSGSNLHNQQARLAGEEAANVKAGLGRGGTGVKGAGKGKDPDGHLEVGKAVDSMEEFKGDSAMRLSARKIGQYLYDKGGNDITPDVAALQAGNLLQQASQIKRKYPEKYGDMSPEQIVELGLKTQAKK